MENLEKIALFIDADNTQLSKMEAVMQEISTHGRIVVKRAYGNWKKDALKNWEEPLKRMAIKAEQQFDYVSGKNATDMALVIDAINLLYRDRYDAFVIVSSDSDYTPLAINLRESGVYIIGVGEKKTPVSFRNSCDEFIYLENLEEEAADETEPENKTSARKHGQQEAAQRQDTGTSAHEGGPENDEPDNMEDIHRLLKIAYEKYQEDDGFTKISSAGAYIKRAKPDFDLRTYGYFKLSQLIEDFPEKYEMTRDSDKGSAAIIAYRCLQQKKRRRRSRG